MSYKSTLFAQTCLSENHYSTICLNLSTSRCSTLSVGRCELPETLSELEDCSIKKIGSTLKTKRVFSDVASKTDICHDVLRNILHVSVLTLHFILWIHNTGLKMFERKQISFCIYKTFSCPNKANMNIWI